MFSSKPRLRPLWLAMGLLASLQGPVAATAPVPTREIPVVLLHGLARSPASMETLAAALQREGYRVCNIGYVSRGATIEDIARAQVAPQVRACTGGADRPVHFVTHSMGGILVRQLAASGELGDIRRVVMLAPPNHGSEVIDELDNLRLPYRAGMPAAAQLGTRDQALPLQLGPPTFETGILAGTRTLNPLLSLRIPGRDDGKVSVASARLEGARDFRALEVSHVFIMVNGEAIAQTLHFLERGAFAPAS